MAQDVLMELELECDERAPRLVRQSLSGLDGVGQSPDLLLISSELVTEAVLHSGCTEQDHLDVRLCRHERGLRLSVSDPGRSGESLGTAPPPPPGAGGLGLKIVEALAARWGQSRERRYEVWAEVAL